MQQKKDNVRVRMLVFGPAQTWTFFVDSQLIKKKFLRELMWLLLLMHIFSRNHLMMNAQKEKKYIYIYINKNYLKKCHHAAGWVRSIYLNV